MTFLQTLAARIFTRRLRKPRLRPHTRLHVETLEDRVQPSVAGPAVESIDGTGNNLAHPDWGSTGQNLLRTAPAAYGDGVSSPAGATRLDARTISNLIASQPENTPLNNRDMSAYVYAWGQFIDHDLDLTGSEAPAQAFNIQVPTGDPQFDPHSTGTQIIPLNRSQYDPLTGTTNPRQQVNSITAWLDGSMIYGSDATTAASLRTFNGGQLKTSTGNLLPLQNGQFLAGDIRAEENPDLTSLQTLFVREHNRLATGIAKANPNLTDEQIYQQARRLVIAELQAITYNEFLPALLGPAAPGAYRGYNPNVNPGIANEFSTAAYRIGHTLVGDDIEFLDNNGNALRDPVSLRDAFFNPTVIQQNGIDPILKYLASDRAQEVDTKVVDDLRNFLFGAPGSGGMDLAALNIQRGRDHGLADYNTVRAAYGLPRVHGFSEITSDPATQAALKQAYGTVDNIDLWVGGLAEDHIPGASVGPTFARIIGNQFERIRDGDRFWYQNVFSGALRDQLDHTTLADVIRRNTTVSNLQDNVFFFKASISGRVFVDQNGDGRAQPNEQGAGGLLVQLIGADGSIVASTHTLGDGTYRFDHLDLGTYTVRVTLPNGAQTTSAKVQLTRGESVCTDIGIKPPPLHSPMPDVMPDPFAPQPRR